MNVRLDKIQRGGYWRVLIRPTDFQSDRLGLNELQPLIESRQVQLRGWYFPHISQREEIVGGIDWIGQDSESQIGSMYVELWRFFTSGQFVWFRSFQRERAPERSALPAHERPLPVYEVINVVTEAFEFAARLALTKAGGATMVVRIQAEGLQGRELIVGDQGGIDADVVARIAITNLKREVRIERSDLIANPRSHALDLSLWLIHRLGWRSASEPVLRRIQQGVFGTAGKE